MTKLRPGDPAPDFELPVTGGGTYRFSDRRGRWVVIAFYPGDFTLVCTRQFCSYRDDAEKLAALDAELVGISPQGIDSHERFAAEHGLTVPLLADVDLAVAQAYGVRAPGGIVRRSTFIVDPDGIVRDADRSLVGLRFADADAIAERLARHRRPK
ncbi:MAG TPA: peroxiredoxin [Solirubrobacterales bacterium]|nr:peroxiredoxin [Solirubrobacterales bacterium]